MSLDACELLSIAGEADGMQLVQLCTARQQLSLCSLKQALTGLLLFSSSQSSEDKIPFTGFQLLRAMFGLPVWSRQSDCWLAPLDRLARKQKREKQKVTR